MKLICQRTIKKKVGHKREVRDIKQLRNGLVVTASMDKTIKIIAIIPSAFPFKFCLNIS